MEDKESLIAYGSIWARSAVPGSFYRWRAILKPCDVFYLEVVWATWALTEMAPAEKRGKRRDSVFIIAKRGFGLSLIGIDYLGYPRRG